jgi:capsular exopolysaccharide synthesis family protein
MNTNNNNNNNHYNGGNMNDGGVREINLRDIFSTLVRGKWVIFIVTLIMFNIFLFKTMLEEPVYEAKTTVFVSSRGQSTPLGFFSGDAGRSIINEIEILKSRNLARNVATAIMERRYLDEEKTEIIPILVNLNEAREIVSYATHEAVAGRLQRSVTFEQVPRSDIITVNARSTNPREAALIADAYSQVYYESHFQGSRAHQRRVREFLETQLNERERALKEAEERLKRYMETRGVVIMDAESRRVINQVAQLEAKREELEVQINASETRLQSLSEQLAEQEPEVARSITAADNPYIRRIQEQIAQLEIQRDQAIIQNPQAIGEQQYQNRLSQIDNQLEGLRSTLRQRSSEFIHSLSTGDEGFLRQLKQRIAEGQIELQGLRIQKNSTDRLLGQYENQFEMLPQINLEYARLERAKQSNEKLYLRIEEQYNQAIISEQSEFGSVNIIDDARVPGSPVSPNLQMNMIIGLFLGIIFGIGFVFVKEALSTKIRTPEDIKKENLVNLTTIASMYGEVKQISKKGWSALRGRVISGFIITVTNPLSPVSEAFRALRTNLQYSQVDKAVKTIVVTSPNPGEGKSTVAANLAVTFAQNEKKVLIIDADLRKPMLHNILDLNKKPGLTNILFEHTDLAHGVQKTVVDNLYAISCGDIPASPADLLGSQKMKKLIERLSQSFNIIIFDTPPVLAATDASVLGTVTDGVVIVTAARSTKVDDLKVSIESIQHVKGHILGTVLNKFDHRDGYGSKYTHQYYQYGSYGKSTNGDRKKRVVS